MPFYIGNVMSKSIECRPRVGVVDTGFAQFSDGLSSNNPNSIKVQPDGKIIVAGNCDILNGVTQNNISRLNIDGTLDTTFNTGANPGANGEINSVAIQPDGKIVVAGSFATLRGVTKNYIGRLNIDGSLDTTFNVGGTVGANKVIRSVELQSDGKILVSGDFLTIRGQTQNGLARLNSDGSLDTTFNNASDGVVGTNVSQTFQTAANIYKFIPLSDGSILIGGEFTTIRGVTKNGFAKLNSNGTVDSTFNVQTGSSDTPGVTLGSISSMVVQDGGKIVIVGSFRTFRGSSIVGLARANADGSRDTAWPASGSTSGVSAGDTIYSCTKQYDNKIVLVGYFTAIRGVVKNGVARINPDGTLDNEFNIGTNVGVLRPSDGKPFVYASELQDDCKVLVGGWFTTARGVTTGNVARFM